MQVILGAGGAIGKELARELKNYDNKVRLFSRNPKNVNDDDELFSGNLLNKKEVNDAVKGTSVAYLTAGLPYRALVWERQWPVIMKNVISACKKHKAKLVFFDNMYLYDKEKLAPMTEETEVNPPSRKGAVRAEIAKMLMDEAESGRIKAMIARAADFYGPGIENSAFNEAILNNLKAGKSANWFCSVKNRHNFTWTPDAAKATAILGNDEKAYGQVWHLPTASNPWTAREFIVNYASEIGVKPKYQTAGKGLVSILGWFDPLMKEFGEMLYQYDRDYVFDSSKFDKTYKFKTTSYAEGLKKIIENKT
jgi:nucleoside-diphosphate-sugar epimerase